MESIRKFITLWPDYDWVYDGTNEGNLVLQVRFKKYLGRSDRKKLKEAISHMGGSTVQIIRIGKDPIFNAQTKRMLRDSSIISLLTFFTAIGGNKVLSSLDFDTVVGMAVIPAVTAFLTKIAFDLKISTGKNDGDSDV
jgi:hypothetical protein